MWGRLNTKPYKQGLALCENMMPDARGTVSGRPGTRHLAVIPNVTDGRLFAYQFQGVLYFIILVDGAMWITDSTGSTPVSHASPYSAAQLAGVIIIARPNSDDIWMLHSDVAPQEMTAAAWTLGAISFTNAPAKWVVGNYPTTCTFYQGRSWFAGMYNDPENFLGSMSGNFTDLTPGVNDNDALDFTLDRKGLIVWIEGGRTLLIGTSNREFVAESIGPIITPSDIQIVQQSAHGSKDVVPIAIGNEEVFISADGRKVRSMVYKWTESGWFANDLTFAADHIMLAGVKDISFARNPDPVLWLVDKDNKLAGCSYQRMGVDTEDLIVGWHRHDLTHDVLDLASDDLEGYSLTGLLQNVGDDIQLSLLGFDEDLIMLDNRVTYDGTETTTITGLDHLEGQTVNVIADGAVASPAVVSSGQIELAIAASVVHVGLGYRQMIETLPLAYYSDSSGAVVHHMKRWNKIVARIYESAKPKIEAIRPATRQVSTPMGTPQPPLTEDVFVTNRGWTTFTQISIYQDLPLILTLLSISGEAAVEQL